MANKNWTQLTAFSGSVDAANDLLALWGNTNSILYKITRNQFLGIASAPLGLTDTQSPTNKTFDNTSTYVTKDANFTLQNSASTTKQMKFSAASITAGQTRTYTMPDVTDTVMTLTATQTVTNKTFTSPTINAPNITNATITADTVSGFSSSSTGTIYGISVTAGTIGNAALAANSVNTTQIAAGAVVNAGLGDGAVTPAKILAGTGTTWPWQSYTPTTTNITETSGTKVGKYVQVGKTIFGYFSFLLGASSAIGSNPTFSLPVTAKSFTSIGTAAPIIGTVWYEHTGVSNAQGYSILVGGSTTTVSLYAGNAASTYFTVTAVTASIPFAFATGDAIVTYFTYEAA